MGLNTITITLGSIAIITLVVGIIIVIKMGQKDPKIQDFIINLFKVLRGEPRKVPLIHVGPLDHHKGKE